MSLVCWPESATHGRGETSLRDAVSSTTAWRAATFHSHAAYNRLPIELWHDTLGLLDRQALLGIALTCKPFYDLSTSLLNKELRVTLSPKTNWKLPRKVVPLRVRSIVVTAQAARVPLTAFLSACRDSPACAH
jgi:hypothetical protein